MSLRIEKHAVYFSMISFLFARFGFSNTMKIITRLTWERFSASQKNFKYLRLGDSNLHESPSDTPGAEWRNTQFVFVWYHSFLHNVVSIKIINNLTCENFFCFTENLQYLRLGDNNLHEVPSDALRALDRLRHLDLRANNITSLAEDTFAHFGDSITFLNLQKNGWVHSSSASSSFGVFINPLQGVGFL